MPKAHVAAIDQGTTSSRCIVFDEKGEVRAIARREHRQIFPRPGWVEHDAEEIWTNVQAVTAEALQAAGLKASDLAAVGITNQRETTVVWERATGRPIHNAIVWQDTRTDALVREIGGAEGADRLRGLTGLPLATYFAGPKIRWLLDNVSGLRARAESGEVVFGTIDAWLVWQLSGGKTHATDVSNASRTLLFNIHTLDWDAELLALLDIPREVLPQVVASSGMVARTACEGLPDGLAVAGIAGDQQAALFGQACHRPGMAKNTYGTGCFLLMNTGEKPAASRNRLLTTVAWQRGGKTAYALEGSVFIAGAAIQWLRDGLGIIERASDIDGLAGTVPDSGGVCFVPALSGLGAPYWDPHARGTIVGITRGTTRAHIARATLESIAFQSAELIEAMAGDSGIGLTELRVDGGATASDLLMQMQADLLGVPVVRPRVTETTALGAAYLAGLAVGFWKDEAQIAALWSRERVFEPTLSRDAAQERLAQWKRAVARARQWAVP